MWFGNPFSPLKKTFMPRKLEAYVEEILKSIAEIESFMIGMDFAG